MSGPAAPPPVLATVRVRMYQVGFGDCFLLSFEYAGQAPARHVLIDFGSRQLADGLDLADVAGEIDTHTGGGPTPHVTRTTCRGRREAAPTPSWAGGSRAWWSGRGPRIPRRPPTRQAPRVRALAAGSAIAVAPACGPGLGQGRAFATALSQAIATSTRGLRGDVRELALAQLANQAAIDRLNAWSRAGTGAYVSYGQPLDLDAVVPGRPGPRHRAADREPSTRRWPSEHATSKEYWQLYQGLASADPPRRPRRGRRGRPGPGRRGRGGRTVVGPARWLVEQLQGPQLRSLLRIVTALDHAMNNTSVILLIQAGDRRLLFCGDAQIENWEYALTVAPDHEQVLDLLRGWTCTRSGTMDPATPRPGPCSTCGTSLPPASGR